MTFLTSIILRVVLQMHADSHKATILFHKCWQCYDVRRALMWPPEVILCDTTPPLAGGHVITIIIKMSNVLNILRYYVFNIFDQNSCTYKVVIWNNWLYWDNLHRTVLTVIYIFQFKKHWLHNISIQCPYISTFNTIIGEDCGVINDVILDNHHQTVIS